MRCEQLLDDRTSCCTGSVMFLEAAVTIQECSAFDLYWRACTEDMKQGMRNEGVRPSWEVEEMYGFDEVQLRTLGRRIPRISSAVKREGSEEQGGSDRKERKDEEAKKDEEARKDKEASRG